MYQFLSACLQSEYKTVKTFRETEQKKVLKIRHIESGRFFVCRLFAGEPEEYKRLLPVKSEFIPEIYEVSYDGRNVLVLCTFENNGEYIKNLAGNKISYTLDMSD